MQIKATSKGKAILITEVEDFDLQQTFECGQAFRWRRVSETGYTGIVCGKVLTIAQKAADRAGTVNLEMSTCTEEDYETLWKTYFDLETNYGEIKKTLAAKDSALRQAVAHGGGIRLLNQDPWEMILTFILSANNNIPRITASVEALSRAYGSFIEHQKGHDWYSLPMPEVLAGVQPEALRPMGLGYRDKYVVETARMLAEGQVDLRGLSQMETQDARRELLKLPGVGPKVAECILLFALGRRDAFPIDTWVKKVMYHFYQDREMGIKDLGKFAEAHFGALAGYAQQYLFYYARENRLGLGK